MFFLVGNRSPELWFCVLCTYATTAAAATTASCCDHKSYQQCDTCPSICTFFSMVCWHLFEDGAVAVAIAVVFLSLLLLLLLWSCRHIFGSGFLPSVAVTGASAGSWYYKVLQMLIIVFAE